MLQACFLGCCMAGLHAARILAAPAGRTSRQMPMSRPGAPDSFKNSVT